ncbi:hypothetical protein ABK040_000974 [Willaertia magna]
MPKTSKKKQVEEETKKMEVEEEEEHTTEEEEENNEEVQSIEIPIMICTGSYDARFVGFNYRYFTSTDPNFSTILEIPEAELISYKEQQKLEETPLISTKFALKPHNASINYLLSLGNEVITVGYDELANVFNMKKLNEEKSIPLQLGTITDIDSYQKNPIISNSSGKVVMLSNKDEYMVMWEKNAHKGPISSLAIHPSGKLLFTTGQNDNKLMVWDMIKGTKAYEVNLGKHAAERVRFSPSGDTFYLLFRNQVQIYDTKSINLLLTLTHDTNVTYLKYLNDNFIMSGCKDGKLVIWDILEGTCYKTIDLHQDRIKVIDSIEVNIGEYCVLSVSTDGCIALWRIFLVEGNLDPTCLFTETFSARLTSACLWTDEHELVRFLSKRKKDLKQKLKEDNNENKEEEKMEESDEE